MSWGVKLVSLLSGDIRAGCLLSHESVICHDYSVQGNAYGTDSIPKRIIQSIQAFSPGKPSDLSPRFLDLHGPCAYTY